MDAILFDIAPSWRALILVGCHPLAMSGIIQRHLTQGVSGYLFLVLVFLGGNEAG